MNASGPPDSYRPRIGEPGTGSGLTVYPHHRDDREGGGVPDPHGPVVAAADKARAVWGDPDRGHLAGVAVKSAVPLFGRAPDPNRTVLAAGGKPAAVRGDLHRGHPVGEVGGAVAALSGGGVPDSYRPVAAGGEPAAVRGDRRCGHSA